MSTKEGGSISCWWKHILVDFQDRCLRGGLDPDVWSEGGGPSVSRSRFVMPSIVIVGSSLRALGIPAPNLCEIFGHVDLLRLQLDHPRVLEHLPGHATAFGVLLQARNTC